LQAAYGSRFSIEIRTTKVSGSGSRTKQIEVFNIVVHDSEGDERTLEMLSGGERVWIRKAIYDAFAIVRARSTGLEFATVFLDEADGALDSESTMMYFRMIAAAHEQSKRAHTIVITHSEIAQEIIGQSINMEGFGNAG
jgi:exonuclease SbcC